VTGVAPPGRLRFEHVAFDLDGTLVDTGDDIAASLNHVLRALGRPALLLAQVTGYVGEGARRLVEQALGAGDAALVERGVALFMTRYGEHLLDASGPYPGVVALLDGLATRGVACSVLTNKPEAMSRAILEGLGLAARFVGVVGGDSLPTRKPDPAGLHRLRALTSTPPERTLLVGDSAIDVRTARAAGAAFCGVAWGFAPDGMRAAGPERVIDHPAELLAVVEGC